MRKYGKMNKRYFEISIIFCVIFLCMVLIYFQKNTNEMNLSAQISINGKVIKTIELSSVKDTTFTPPGNNSVSFQIVDHKIRFINVDCPDKLCEKSGFLSHSNEVAICLPNKVSLTLVSNKNDLDIIVN